MKLAPIQSLAQLKSKIQRDNNYKIAVVGIAHKMGIAEADQIDSVDSDRALKFIETCIDDEGEAAILEEINACLREITNEGGGTPAL